MISKECFVYIQLPKSLEVVTVGKLNWEKTTQIILGKFIYGQKYYEMNLPSPLTFLISL